MPLVSAAAEQSSSAGVLIEDKLQLGEDGVDVIFGCETKETGEIFNQEADGIMGLGNSEVSLVNQVRLPYLSFLLAATEAASGSTNMQL